MRRNMMLVRIVFLLVISSTFFGFLREGRTIDSNQLFDARSRAMQFLGNISGLEMNSCVVLSYNDSTSLMPSEGNMMTNARVLLIDGDKNYEALLTFIDGRFWKYGLTQLSGSPPATSGDLTICLGKLAGAMAKYQTIFNASYCAQFVDVVLEAAVTKSRILDRTEARLDISYNEDMASVSDGVRVKLFSKIGGQFTTPFRSLQASLSTDGLLVKFTDNIGIYHLEGGGLISLSEAEAIGVASPYTRDYANKHGQNIAETSATLEYVPDLARARGSSFMIYPQWTVHSTFDKSNSANIKEYTVLVWADNGQVYHYGPQGYFENSNLPGGSTLSLAFVLIALVAVFILGVNIYAKRKNRRKK